MNKNIKIEVSAVLHKKDGSILKKYPWKKANCLIKAFIQILMVQISQVAENIIDTTNQTRAVSPHAGNFTAPAALNETGKGIVIGEGTDPVAMANYKLQTQKITNVVHGAQSIALTNPNAATWRIGVQRTLTNNTGGVLSIKEVGLYVRATGSEYYFCVERTLYAVDVPDGLPITFIYRITITL